MRPVPKWQGQIMWYKIKIAAKEGMQFGILYDEQGELALVVKNPNEDWPHGLTPTAGQNQIGKNCKVYIIVTDEYYNEQNSV